MVSLVYNPPDYPFLKGRSLFLAGTIEMGNSWNWQETFIEKMKNASNCNTIWTILNPRRPDWNSEWGQSVTDARFYQQVDWELTYLERASHRVFYFVKDSISPITLMEFGKFGELFNSFVCCEEGYKKKGNVDIFCHKFKIPIVNNMDDLIKQLNKS